MNGDLSAHQPSDSVVNLRCTGLGKRFDRTWVVEDLTFEVQRGEIYGLLGPNGAGKTTTLRMLAGLYVADAGLAEVCGVPPDEARRRGKIGLLTEHPGFYDRLSALYNLVYFARLYGLPRDEALSRAGALLKRLDLYAAKDKPFAVLSRGMKQKLAIARALIHRPQVILLDEPTVGLDPEATAEVRLLIRELAAEGCSILMCTHDLHEVEKLCSRVAFLARRLVAVRDARPQEDTTETVRVKVSMRAEGDKSGTRPWWPTWACPLPQQSVDRGNGVIDEFFDLPHRGRLPEFITVLVQEGVCLYGVSEQVVTLESTYIELLAQARAEGVVE